MSAVVHAELSRATPNGRARAAALAASGAASAPESPELIDYRSAGRVLILGDPETAIASARVLGDRLNCVLVLAPDAPAPEPPSGARLIRARLARLSGHLGAYRAEVSGPQGDVDLGELLPDGPAAFDLVLDLGMPPALDRETPPFGYYAPRGDSTALQAALDELPEMVGEFEKPRFFVYDAALCAHGNSGLQGCTRCLEVCPTHAITSLETAIRIDPYLCQGAGSCASVCPSGAIGYAYPPADDLLSRLRRLLAEYRVAGGQNAVVLFHDAEHGAERLRAGLAELPECVFPVELAEIGSVGLETWLAVLAYGAEAVALYATAETPPSVSRALDAELGYARATLAGLGYPASVLQRIGALAELDPQPAPGAGAARPAATFASFGGKREVFRRALKHLHALAPAAQEQVSLPAGAPFGAIDVNREACTLCMGCVSVCPAGALEDGAELPRLVFKESHCVQCGLCAKACPEQAIALQPRLAYAAHLEPGPAVLNEDTPLNCSVCGKPFGTEKMVARIAARLGEHWMFQNPEARARLRMCEDCRVHDIFARSGGLEVYDKPG